MKEFISVHQMVFGGRGSISGGSGDNFLFKNCPDD
jgi:hypothetical protein